MKRSIIVRTSFEGMHQYKDAPEEVKFLRDLHRHIFYIEAEMEVSHNDRELEFIMVKRGIEKFIKDDILFSDGVSCEQMAEAIIKYLIYRYGERQMIVGVYEDNENGGKIYHEC